MSVPVPEVTEECVAAFKASPSPMGVLFCLDEGGTVRVRKMFPQGTPFSEFVAAFPETDIAWAVINIKYITKENGKRIKNCWISWIPTNFQRKTQKETVAAKFTCPMVMSKIRAKCGGTSEHGFHHHATSPAGLEINDLVERVSKFERDAIDLDSVVQFAAGKIIFT
eukprot:TRINITY_DN1012_c0_g1_i1.p1 TRINITY_DN1012_c0_g1~~TRINITY_DN1012_c0_g1_i1.p1  ORF type:complete len:185 (-),score=64.61 TRINITY_DN1012_c0_g1_i1:118-618(-)